MPAGRLEARSERAPGFSGVGGGVQLRSNRLSLLEGGGQEVRRIFGHKSPSAWRRYRRLLSPDRASRRNGIICAVRAANAGTQRASGGALCFAWRAEVTGGPPAVNSRPTPVYRPIRIMRGYGTGDGSPA